MAFNENSNSAICDAGAVLNQLSYQANGEQVVIMSKNILLIKCPSMCRWWSIAPVAQKSRVRLSVIFRAFSFQNWKLEKITAMITLHFQKCCSFTKNCECLLWMVKGGK